jgi:hypothetical protein
MRLGLVTVPGTGPGLKPATGGERHVFRGLKASAPSVVCKGWKPDTYFMNPFGLAEAVHLLQSSGD